MEDIFIIGVGSKIYENAKVIVDENHEVLIGDHCTVGDFAFVGARKLVMAEGSQIGPHTVIGGGGTVVLGKYSVVGFGAMLFPATDTVEAEFMCEAAPPEKRRVIRGSIILGDRAYVGAGAIICVSKRCKDILIGDNSVVGAGSYIDRTVPPDTIIYPKVEYVIKKRVIE